MHHQTFYMSSQLNFPEVESVEASQRQYKGRRKELPKCFLMFKCSSVNKKNHTKCDRTLTSETKRKLNLSERKFQQRS